jgi:ABC-2 type transport system permease protein
MSPVDVLSGRPAQAPVKARRLVSSRFLRSELGMVFRRRRNQAMLLVLAAIPVLIAVAVKLTSDGPGGGGGPAFFNSITDNGIFVALASMLAIMPLFLPMAVSVVSGEAVAGEAHIGTLRYLLTVPVSRTRMLAVKYASLVVWCVATTAVVAVAGTLIGLLLFGGGDVVTLSGTSVSFLSGVWRLVLVVGYVSAMMAVVGAIGLFVSTLTEVPVAALATTLALIITSQVLDAVPQLASIHAWLPSHYWFSFIDLLRDPIASHTAQHGLVVGCGYVVVFTGLAWARFATKDVSS